MTEQLRKSNQTIQRTETHLKEVGDSLEHMSHDSHNTVDKG